MVIVDYLKTVVSVLPNGVAQGAMIALVALGYTMVYGVLRLINFAHSEVLMMSAYVAYRIDDKLLGGFERGGTRGLILSTLVAIVAAAVLGVTIERVAYKPLRAAKGATARIAPLVTAIGVSMLLQSVAQLAFSATPQKFDPRLAPPMWFVIVAAAVVMALLYALVHLTWMGKAMRAVAVNEEAARLMGIRPSRIIVFTFAVGSALAAIGAVLYSTTQASIEPTMGTSIGTLAFVAAVVGGIGSVPGARLGGILLGILGEIVKTTSFSGMKDAIVFVLLVVVLLVKPAGLLGSARAEKV
ncbi:MAG: branched-chain amino acid ABC transporter permease [Polyangiales bacterium]